MKAKSKRKIKLIVFYMPENSDDMFVDVEFLNDYKKARPMNEYYYQGIVLGFGKNVFVFDRNSCEFFEKKDKS